MVPYYPIVQDAVKPRRKELVLVGDEACGKTSLCNAFMHVDFTNEYVPTGLQKYEPDTEVDGKKIILWDTSGKENDQQRNQAYSPEMNVIVMCFAVNNPRSLQSIIARWIPEVRRQFSFNVPILMVANKIDLRKNTVAGRIRSAEVDTEEGRSIAEKIGAWEYLECSALTREGVDNVFENALRAAHGEKVKIGK